MFNHVKFLKFLYPNGNLEDYLHKINTFKNFSVKIFHLEFVESIRECFPTDIKIESKELTVSTTDNTITVIIPNPTFVNN